MCSSTKIFKAMEYKDMQDTKKSIFRKYTECQFLKYKNVHIFFVTLKLYMHKYV